LDLYSETHPKYLLNNHETNTVNNLDFNFTPINNLDFKTCVGCGVGITGLAGTLLLTGVLGGKSKKSKKSRKSKKSKKTRKTRKTRKKY
jgi:hypothetical protein